MKRLIGILIISLFYSLLSNAQNLNINETSIIRINDCDSTYIVKLFEISINEEKVYAINPVMNYLDIKGGKQKYLVNVTKTNWYKIENLLLEINFSNFEKVTFDNNSCSITVFYNDTKGVTYITQIENELIKLKEILRIIREE